MRASFLLLLHGKLVQYKKKTSDWCPEWMFKVFEMDYWRKDRSSICLGEMLFQNSTKHKKKTVFCLVEFRITVLKKIPVYERTSTQMRSSLIDSKLRTSMTALAYLDRGHSDYRLVFPLPRHHISSLHTEELVNYIHVFVIAFPACMS